MTSHRLKRSFKFGKRVSMSAFGAAEYPQKNCHLNQRGRRRLSLGDRPLLKIGAALFENSLCNPPTI